MNIYLASRYEHRPTMALLAVNLRMAGHTVVSSWLNDPDNLPGGVEGALTPDLAERIILQNEADIDRCDLLAVFPDYTPHSGSERGGHWDEFGYARAKRKDVAVVGPCKAVQAFHPRARRFATVAAFLSWAEAQS